MTGAYKTDKPRLVSSEILLGSLEAAEEIGIDLKDTLNKCGIEPKILKRPEGFLAFHQVVNFLDAVDKSFNCPHFGFLVGKHQPSLRYGIATQSIKLSPNVESGIENSIHYSALYSEGVKWQLSRENDYAYLTRLDRVPYHSSLVQLHTLGVTQVFKMLQVLCGDNWKATSISFDHSAPEAKNQYERFFKTSVHFDQEFNGVVFPEADLHKPLKTANAELLEIVQAHLTSLRAGYDLNDNIATKTRSHIRQRLGTYTCNIESVAQLLGLHPRALQRELAKHNCTFKQLLLEIRHEVAEHYLRSSNIPLADLAELLGYRNVSAFSRAFKNSCGSAPDHWKKIIRAHHG